MFSNRILGPVQSLYKKSNEVCIQQYKTNVYVGFNFFKKRCVQYRITLLLKLVLNMAPHLSECCSQDLACIYEVIYLYVIMSLLLASTKFISQRKFHKIVS